jgi:CRP-like cAMP-binding protein
MVSPELLRRFPYFHGVSDDVLKAVAMIAEEREFNPGDVLFREDQSADHLFIIAEGEVDIQYVLGNGEHKSVDTLVGGELMVWSAVIAPHRTHSKGVATKKGRCVAIEAGGLRELIGRDLMLGFGLMSGIAQAVSHRLEGARAQLATLS